MLVGVPASGKTTLMVTSIRQFEEAFALQNDLMFGFADAGEERAFRSWTERLDRGKLLDKTLRSATRAFTLSITPPARPGSRVYLYDAAGEDFTSEDELVRHQFHRFMDGIVFLIDPSAERGVIASQRSRRQAGQGRNGIDGTESHEILGTLINSLEARLGVRAGDNSTSRSPSF